MTVKRVAVYLVCATVLAAWLASAAGVMNQPEAPAQAPAPVQTTGTESLAEEVQAHAGRLRERLASAPVPQRPARNPFQFAPRVTAAPKRVVAPAPAAVETVPILPEPQLLLVGIAEDAAATGPVRTAILTVEGGDTLLLRAGEFIGARYRVKAIGADAVELSDLTNGTVRRLVLR